MGGSLFRFTMPLPFHPAGELLDAVRAFGPDTLRGVHGGVLSPPSDRR
ncbi:hypothetical protein PUR34_18970 [Streptomyces sp. JV185]|nr:hypothetical protein [Streptomyces sp. JV185]MEE1770166.1 hypothetical protein [Streptomyces sp. JV185]